MQIKRLFLLFISIFAVTVTISAQKLSVESMETLTTDLYARTHKRDDKNGVPCALVRVSLTVSGATFGGNVIDDNIPRDGSDYLVYMPAGSKKLWVKHPDYHSLEINFADYGIARLEALTTYRVIVNVPQVGAAVQKDNGLTYFVLTVTPKDAKVEIDGNQQPLDSEGGYSILLSRGNHTYTVSAGGYESKTETFTLGVERKSVNVQLESTMASLSIKTATTGAGIYINEQKKGTTSWSGALSPGNYNIEARLDGYYPYSETVMLSARQQKTLNITALTPRTGMLDVSYKPIDSEVWIDGVKAGVSPDVFKNILVGNHKVTIKKEGYKPQNLTVNIKEGETLSLTGRLEKWGESQTFTVNEISSNNNGLTFTVNGISFTMMPVEGGSFIMGATSEQGSDADSDEKPVHQVTISSYYIGKYEVTQDLWKAVMGKKPSKFKGYRKPVEQVSWDDCHTFISKLNSLTGKRFRLPTEAEWEFASRGGNKSRGYKYSGSNNIEDVAWYRDNSGRTTHDVGTKSPNELGIYDMSGNVWEWCQDWYDNYDSCSQVNPTDPNRGSYRVNRGGSWSSTAGVCRSSCRSSDTPSYCDYYIGFRLVLSEF